MSSLCMRSFRSRGCDPEGCITKRFCVASDKIAKLILCRSPIYVRLTMFQFGRRLSSYAAETPAKIGHDPLDTLFIIVNYIFTISATATLDRLVIHPPDLLSTASFILWHAFQRSAVTLARTFNDDLARIHIAQPCN